MADITIGDDSGCASMRLRGDAIDTLTENAGIEVRNAKVVMVRNKIRVEVDKFGKICALDQPPTNVNLEHNVSDIE